MTWRKQIFELGLATICLVFFGAACSTNTSETNSISGTQNSVVNVQPKNTFSNGTIVITNKLAERTAFAQASFDISTTSDGATKVIVYRKDTSIASFPIVTAKAQGTITLEEGINDLSFRLADDSGGLSNDKATASIALRTKPPEIFTSCVVSTGKPLFILDDTKEWACVEFGSATGPQYGTASWPIHGAVSSKGVKVYVNGKLLSPSSSDNYINQKVSLPVSLGTNIYEITAKDDLGNQAKDRTSIDWTDTSQATQTTPDTTDNGGCCKVCTNGQACGDSCISWSYTCHKGPGCACQG